MIGLELTNCVDACDDGRQRIKDPRDIRMTIWHRLSFARDTPALYQDVSAVFDPDLTALEAAIRFRDRRKYRPGAYTGGEMPYGALVRPSGEIQQALRFGDYGPHARRWSRIGFGIAVVGDFRGRKPSKPQWASCVALGAALHALGCEARGHDELAGGSSDPNKECPGRNFRMHDLRAAIAEHPYARLSRSDACYALTEIGFAW